LSIPKNKNAIQFLTMGGVQDIGFEIGAPMIMLLATHSRFNVQRSHLMDRVQQSVI
jgi:hypothetical protein